MDKIILTDTPKDVIIKMSEGVPGALRICMEILQRGQLIDPDGALGGLGILLSLDTLKIYGSRIWMLYKDVCKENLIDMLAVLRANQLGYISTIQLNRAIDNRGIGIDIKDCYKKVKIRLPNFNKVISKGE